MLQHKLWRKCVHWFTDWWADSQSALFLLPQTSFEAHFFKELSLPCFQSLYCQHHFPTSFLSDVCFKPSRQGRSWSLVLTENSQFLELQEQALSNTLNQNVCLPLPEQLFHPFPPSLCSCCRVSPGVFWEGLCLDLPVPERSRLRPHQRAVHVPDGLHGAALRAQWAHPSLCLGTQPLPSCSDGHRAGHRLFQTVQNPTELSCYNGGACFFAQCFSHFRRNTKGAPNYSIML